MVAPLLPLVLALSTRPLRIGLVGTGRMALTHLAALKRQPVPISVPVVVSQRTNLPAELRELAPDAMQVPTLREAGPLDGVVIASSSNCNAALTLDAIHCGVPSIFVEKPVAMSLREAEMVDSTLRRSKAPPLIQVGFHRRHDFCFHRLRRDFANTCRSYPTIVRSLHLISYDAEPPQAQAAMQGASAEFAEQAGSLFVDFSTHDFDMLRWLTGDEFHVHTVMHQSVAETGEEESVIVLRGQRTGCRAVVENSRSCGYGHDQRAHLLLSNGVELRTEGDAVYLPNRVYPSFLERYAGAYRNQMALFMRAAQRRACGGNGDEQEEEADQIALPTFADAVASLKLAMACEEALQTQRESQRIAVLESLRAPSTSTSPRFDEFSC